MKNLISSALIVLSFCNSVAQPEDALCPTSGITTLSINANCTSTAIFMDKANYTFSDIAANGKCGLHSAGGFGSNYDGWYKFTGDGSDVIVNLTGNKDMSLAVYQSVDCANLPADDILTCDIADADDEVNLTFRTVNGTEYYILLTVYQNQNFTGSICVYNRPSYNGPGGVSNCTSWFNPDHGVYTDLAGSIVTTAGNSVARWDNKITSEFIPFLEGGKPYASGVVAGKRSIIRDNNHFFNFNRVLDVGTDGQHFFSDSINAFDVFSNLGFSAFGIGNVSDRLIIQSEPGTNPECGSNRCSSGFRNNQTEVNQTKLTRAGNNSQMWNKANVFGLIADPSSNVHKNTFNGLYNSGSSSLITGAKPYAFYNGCFSGSTGYDRVFTETCTFNKELTDIERDKVQSYFAIKYGVTLGGTTAANARDYLYSDESEMWNGDAVYRRNVAGIVRDDVSELNQLKSHSVNTKAWNIDEFDDSLTIVNGSNFNSPAAIGSDLSGFVWAKNDGGANSFSAVTTFQSVGGQDFNNLLDKQYFSKETGVIDDVVLQFGIKGYGYSDLSKVALLIDTDDDFTAGAIHISPSSFNTTTGIIEYIWDFEASSGFYFTLAESPDVILSENLLSLNSSVVNSTVENNWFLNDVSNVDMLVLQRSQNGTSFYDLHQVENIKKTSFIDLNPIIGESYYRLKQVNGNGSVLYSSLNKVKVNGVSDLQIYPNPSEGNFNFNFQSTNTDYVNVFLFDIYGRKLLSINNQVNEGNNDFQFNISEFPMGNYILEISSNNGNVERRKIIKK